tara:strand:- start:501 stop:671 length:171 start_codon:yes stop_codon:yes gene_type:complete
MAFGYSKAAEPPNRKCTVLPAVVRMVRMQSAPGILRGTPGAVKPAFAGRLDRENPR